MRDRKIVIELSVPPFGRRAWLLTCAGILGIGTLAYAVGPLGLKTFAAGDKLDAAAMSKNFSDIQVAVNELQQKATTGDRLVRARLALTSTGCTVVSQSTPNWLSSCGRNSPGDYTMNIMTSTFSDVPSCSIQSAGGTNQPIVAVHYGASATSYNFVAMDSAAMVATDVLRTWPVICVGPQ